jgi:hypothetical protein
MKNYIKTFLLCILLVLLWTLQSCKKNDLPVLITFPVTDITENSAKSGGSVTSEGSGPVTDRGICWSNDATPSVTNNKISAGSGTGDFVSTLSGLTASATYFVRAYASNSAGTSYGNEESFKTSSSGYQTGHQIIADHNVVNQYTNIPQQWIDSVKKMLVWVAGISHSYGYQRGLDLLELYDSRYQVLTYTTDPPPAYSNKYLRLGRPYWTGEEGFYTSQSAINSFETNHIKAQYDTGNPFDIILYAWCYTMTWENDPGGTKDPSYNVRWAGSSFGGPEGNLRWGIDNGDKSLTGNSVCMDTYLDAINQYNQYSKSKNYKTKLIFATGPVDGNSGTENGFQRELKQNYIRNYVLADESRILFDYADILYHNNSGEKYMVNWNDGSTSRPHAQIHPDNMMDYNSTWSIITPEPDATEDHIGEVGALRLAKAMWWMLARIAGWDGN